MNAPPVSGIDRRRRLPDRRLWSRMRGRLLRTLGHPTINWNDIGDRLTWGRHSYGQPKVRWYHGDWADVHIGSFCSIADEVVFMVGGTHPIDWVSTFPFRAHFGLPGAYFDGNPVSKGDINVGNDVYIGRDARILSGVSIGHGAVVGANAVVTKDVRPYAVVVGNPAREARRRFDDQRVERLLRINWWDWPDEKIFAEVPRLASPDIDAFLDAHDPLPASSRNSSRS